MNTGIEKRQKHAATEDPYSTADFSFAEINFRTKTKNSKTITEKEKVSKSKAYRLAMYQSNSSLPDH